MAHSITSTFPQRKTGIFETIPAIENRKSDMSAHRSNVISKPPLRTRNLFGRRIHVGVYLVNYYILLFLNFVSRKRRIK